MLNFRTTQPNSKYAWRGGGQTGLVLLAIVTMAMCNALSTMPAIAGTISHVINERPVDLQVDLTAQGVQDWRLVTFDQGNSMFVEHNRKAGGSGITLVDGFNVAVGTAYATDSTQVGANFNYADGLSPVAESPVRMALPRGNKDEYAAFNKVYSMTFDVIALGEEHTANVYLVTGRTIWIEIEAAWATLDPIQLSTDEQGLNAVYTLTYTPTSFTDSVKVTFTAAPGMPEGYNGDFRLGVTAATLSATPEPSGVAALFGMAMVGFMALWRRRK